MSKEHPAHTNILEGIGGWNSILLVWDEELGFYEPLGTGLTNTSLGAGTKRSAIIEAMDWAEAEGVEYRGPSLDELEENEQ